MLVEAQIAGIQSLKWSLDLYLFTYFPPFFKRAIRTIVSCGFPPPWFPGSCRGARNNSSHSSLECLRKSNNAARTESALDVQQQGNHLSAKTFYRLCQVCSNKKDLAAARELHNLVKGNGFQSNAFLGSQLIRMFALCGSLLDANQVFTELQEPNVVTWSSIIHAHTKLGQSNVAIKLYYQMLESNIQPGEYVFVAVLQACSKIAGLAEGMMIHGHIIQHVDDLNVFVGSALIDMYAKCKRLGDAQNVFDQLRARNVVTWTAMMNAYSQHGHGQAALELFKQMQVEGMEPNDVSYICALKACSTLAALEQGKVIHDQIVQSGCRSNESIANTLINMYAKCGNLEDMHAVFDSMPYQSIVTWSAMIAGYAQRGHGQEALQMFQQMRQEGLEPTGVTFVSILQACSSTEALEQGKLVHVCIMNIGCESDLFVGNALIDMYAKCGSLQEARMLFNKSLKRDVVTWSAIIAGYAEKGGGEEALHLFQQMQHDGMKPDNVTFGCVLKACSRIAALEKGRSIHALIMKSGCELNEFIGNSVIDMYAKCTSLEDARQVFDRLPKRDVVTWSAMIAGYAQHGHGKEALRLFKKMQQGSLGPDNVILVCILKACSNTAALDQGKLMHVHAVQSDSEMDLYVGNTLVDLYVNCGRLADALKVFDNLSKRHVETWSVMITGLVQHGHAQEALCLYQQMQEEGMEPDIVMFVCTLKACSSLATLHHGKLIHAKVQERGCEVDFFVGSTLVDMYAKCGSLEDAHRVFHKLTNQDVVAWSAMIAGYAENNDYQLALEYFEGMQQAGLKPNDVTYVSLLSACSRKGLIDEGCYHFQLMTKEHGITPTLDHYNCIVDLFGRAGHLEKAEDLLQTMPFLPSRVAWMSLLSHCRTHINLDLGSRCFDSMVMIDERHASGYVLMSKIYVDAHLMEHADEVEEHRKYAHAWKKVGKAFIEAGNKLHQFFVGDEGHGQSQHIHVKLKKIHMQIKEEGHVPLVDLVLQPMLDEDVEDFWCEQLERPSIAFG